MDFGDADRATGSKGLPIPGSSDLPPRRLPAPTSVPRFSSNAQVVSIIISRIRARAGFNIQPWIDLAGAEIWLSNPAGFRFKATKPMYLNAALANSQQFGLCAGWDRGQVPAGGNSYREISEDGSLHIIIDFIGAKSIIHLDSVSIAKARRSDGFVEYADASRLSRHAAVDFLHLSQDWVQLAGEEP